MEFASTPTRNLPPQVEANGKQSPLGDFAFWLLRIDSYKKMNKRILLLLAGAVGIIVAALFCFLALYIQGALQFLVLLPNAGIVFFLLLLAVSLFEIAVMTMALRRFAKQFPFGMVCLIAAGYVGFAGIYALLYALLVPDTRGIEILTAFCFVRWATLFLVRV